MTVSQFSHYIRKKYKAYVFLAEKKNDAYSRRIVILSILDVSQGYRRRGIGSKVMAELCAFADHNGIILGLSPSAEYGTPRTVLHRFYRSFGFKTNKDTSISTSMIRIPGRK